MPDLRIRQYAGIPVRLQCPLGDFEQFADFPVVQPLFDAVIPA
jgi:hypothetical protein